MNEEKKTWFNPTLSFDGVALLIGVVSVAFFVGVLKSNTDKNTTDIEELKKAVTSLVSVSSQQNQSIAVLQTEIQERKK